jgi:hypothetical protein
MSVRERLQALLQVLVPGDKNKRYYGISSSLSANPSLGYNFPRHSTCGETVGILGFSSGANIHLTPNAACFELRRNIYQTPWLIHAYIAVGMCLTAFLPVQPALFQELATVSKIDHKVQTFDNLADCLQSRIISGKQAQG